MLEQKWSSACNIVHRTRFPDTRNSPVSIANSTSRHTQQRKSKSLIPCDGDDGSEHKDHGTAAVALLKSCAKQNNLLGAIRIHADVRNKGLLKNVYVGSALVNAYAKCGALERARNAFDDLPARGLIAWTSLLAGYAEQGPFEEALKCLENMQHDGFVPDSVTFVCVLKACGSIGTLEKGRRYHIAITRGGCFRDHVFVGNALVDMYAKCGAIDKAQEVFDELQFRDISSWNVLVTAYAQHENAEGVLECFCRMQSEGFLADHITFIGVIKACSSLETLFKSSLEMHVRIFADISMEKHVSVGNALVDMYSKHGMISVAHRIFDELRVRDAITWNVLIAACIQHGYGKEALGFFDQMQHEGFSPDGVTFICILKACGMVGAVEKGQLIHAEIMKEGCIKEYNLVGNALVDMYVKCGLMEKAHEVFEELPFQNESSWNTLISGYAQHGLGEKAIACFERMQSVGLSPDTITFVCILRVCGKAGTMQKGEEVHAAIVSEGLSEHVLVGNALLDMYAKCGAVAEAQDMFDEFVAVMNVTSWNSLLLGYAHLGQAEKAFALFNKMKRQGVRPDFIAFLIMLYTCNHVGLIVKGQICFHMMNVEYGIIPNLQHYSCMIDLFARAGDFNKAMEIIKGMPFFDNLVVWRAVLSGCQKEDFGLLAFKLAVELMEMVELHTSF